MKVKILKDLKFKYPFETLEEGQPTGMIKREIKEIIFSDELKALAIKWIKEDLSEMVVTPNTTWLLNRWIKRLDITEEDLE